MELKTLKFEKLNDTIPYAIGGKVKSLVMEPYDGVFLAMPGRHADQTTPKGGDFVVMVTDPIIGWNRHQFTHDDIFRLIEDHPGTCSRNVVLAAYLKVVTGADPDKVQSMSGQFGHVLENKRFLHAMQCLAVAEHRRYAHYEEQFGGRFLPFRFAAGIGEELWTANDAIKVQKYGRPAVERLEKKHGVPALTAKLMGLDKTSEDL